MAVNQTLFPMIIVKPNAASAAAISATEREQASASRGSARPAMSRSVATSGRRGLTRRAAMPPPTAPAPHDADSTPQAGAPPSERAAMTGPSTNRAGIAKLPQAWASRLTQYQGRMASSCQPSARSARNGRAAAQTQVRGRHHQPHHHAQPAGLGCCHRRDRARCPLARRRAVADHRPRPPAPRPRARRTSLHPQQPAGWASRLGVPSPVRGHLPRRRNARPPRSAHGTRTATAAARADQGRDPALDRPAHHHHAASRRHRPRARHHRGPPAHPRGRGASRTPPVGRACPLPPNTDRSAATRPPGPRSTGVSTGKSVRDQGAAECSGMDCWPAISPVSSSRKVRSSSVTQVRYGRQLPLMRSSSWVDGGCGRP